MSMTLISANPVPNGVTLLVCTAPEHATENCPSDYTETWGRINAAETDALFFTRVRREMKALVQERIAPTRPAVPVAIRNLVGQAL